MNDYDGELVINNMQESYNGRQYRLRLNGCNGATKYSAPSTLGYREGQPEFVSAPLTQSTIEGSYTVFTATGNEFTKSMQWQYKRTSDSSFKNFSDSTSYDAGKTFVAGAKSTVLNLKNVQTDMNDAKIRCVITNVTNQRTADADLHVANKSFSGFRFSYPYATVDYGTTINSADIYVFVKYNSGDADFGRNFTGLTFGDGTTEKVMNTLGAVDLPVKVTADGVKYTGNVAITVVDKSAPKIENVSVVWDDDESPLTNTLSNDINRKVRITVNAADNYPIGNVQYSFDDGLNYGLENTRIVTSNEGNGIFCIRVKDDHENATDNEHVWTIDLKAWDTTAPTVDQLITTPDIAFSQYRTVEVVGNDDIGLAIEAYSYDGSEAGPGNWVRNNTHVYTTNSADLGCPSGYPIYVRDKAGNVSACAYAVIEGIDKVAPTFLSCERTVDGVDEATAHPIVTITAQDDQPGETITYSCYWNDEDAATSVTNNYPIGTLVDSNETGIFTMPSEYETSINHAKFTFRMEDLAGNRTEIVQAISLETIGLKDYEKALSSSWLATPTTWVNKETGVDLISNISTIAECSDVYNSLYPEYQFSMDTDSGRVLLSEQAENTYHITDNGTYYIGMYGNVAGEKDATRPPYTTNPISITNIDDVKPTLTTSITATGIDVTATDNESGIKEIRVAGGEYGEEGEIVFPKQYDDPNAEPQSTQMLSIPAMRNTAYRITVIDAVGNTNGDAATDPSGKPGEDIVIDGRPTIKPTQVGIDLHPMTWTNCYVQAVANVADEVADNLASMPFKWSNEEINSFFSDTYMYENGELSLSVEDKWGNVFEDESWKVKIDNIDKSNPQTVIAQTGNQLYIHAKDEDSGLAMLSMTNLNTGKKNLIYHADGSETKGPEELNESLMLLQNSSYEVTAYDLAGNVSKLNFTAENVPEFDAATLASYVSIYPSNYTQGNVSLTLNMPTAYAKMLGYVPYAWNKTTVPDPEDNLNWSASPSTIATDNGTYYVSIELADGSVITSAPIEVTNIDRTSPEADIAVSGEKATVMMTDRNSGVKKLTYSLSDGTGENSYDYGIGMDRITQDIILPTDGTYLFKVEDVAGNYKMFSATSDGKEITAETLSAWITVTDRNKHNARININVPTDKLHLLADKPFLWSGQKSYTDVFSRLVTKNGKYYVTVKLANGKTVISNKVKITGIEDPDDDDDDDDSNSNGGGGTTTTPGTTVTPAVSNNTIQTIIKYIHDGVQGNETTGNKAEKDKTGPELNLKEVSRKIVVTVSDNSGIDKITWQKQGETKETTLVQPNGSKEISFKMDPKENGTHTFTAYDTVGNKTTKKITITDVMKVVSDNKMNEKADTMQFISSEDTTSDNTVSSNVVGTETDGGFKWFLLIPLLLLLILIVIGVLYYLNKKKENKPDEDDIEDFEDEEVADEDDLDEYSDEEDSSNEEEDGCSFGEPVIDREYTEQSGSIKEGTSSPKGYDIPDDDDYEV